MRLRKHFSVVAWMANGSLSERVLLSSARARRDQVGKKDIGGRCGTSSKGPEGRRGGIAETQGLADPSSDRGHRRSGPRSHTRSPSQIQTLLRGLRPVGLGAPAAALGQKLGLKAEICAGARSAALVYPPRGGLRRKFRDGNGTPPPQARQEDNTALCRPFENGSTRSREESVRYFSWAQVMLERLGCRTSWGARLGSHERRFPQNGGCAPDVRGLDGLDTSRQGCKRTTHDQPSPQVPTG